MHAFRSLGRSCLKSSNQPWLSSITISQQGQTVTSNANQWLHHHLTCRTLILQSLASETVKLNKLDGSDSGIVEVSLDRPKNKNAIDSNLMRGLRHVLELINQDSAVNVAIVTSSVPGVFCAGADLKERRTFTATAVRDYVKYLRATFTYLEALPIPSIAAVDGAALGGGLELALACDLRICGEDALLGLPETGHAIIPGAGGTRRLPRLVGKATAKDIILTGRKVLGRDAVSMGLANYCVPTGEVYPKALEVARTINEKGPIATRSAKRAIEEGLQILDWTEGVALEEECYERTLHTKDRLEGLSAFVEKRKPRYSGE